MNLNRVLVDVESKIAWVEAGATLGEIYYEVSRASSHFGFPAGLYPTIGSGGHIEGGGWGLKSRKYGLASDNVVDAILVDSNGLLLDHQMMGDDVFWAIRGGRPGSFGAVYSWKISLVDVPDKVTAFRIMRNGSVTLTISLLHKWQFVAPKLEDEVTLLASIRSEPDTTNMVATFLGLYLGPKHATLASINRTLPELGLHGSECNELSWIESMAYFSGINQVTTVEALRDRFSTSDQKNYYKWKGDFVRELISLNGIEGILGMLMKKLRMELALSPLGGIMSRIKSDMVPFPHRKINLYSLGHFGPRASYVNEIDLDLGVMDWENVSMSGDELVEVGRAWGEKYFMGNYDLLNTILRCMTHYNLFDNLQLSSDDSNTVDKGNNSSSNASSKKDRGLTRGSKSLPNGKKKKIGVNSWGQPNQANSETNTYSSDIGFQVRVHFLIIYESFNDVPNDRIALVVKGLEECYDISHVAWFDLKEKIRDAWKRYKSHLNTTLIVGNSPGDVKASPAPEFVPREDWAKSKRNKENWAKLIVPCTFGRTSMPITRHKLAEERGVADEEIGRVEVYIQAHTKKDKTIQCPDAELQNTMRNDPKSIRTGPNDAIGQKFVKERKGGTRGMGAGMSISLVEKVGHIVNENEELLSNNNELKFATEKLRKYLDALTKYVGNIPASYVISPTDNLPSQQATSSSQHEQEKYSVIEITANSDVTSSKLGMPNQSLECSTCSATDTRIYDGKSEWIDALLYNINENIGWKFVLCSIENQELWVLQWVAGIEMHYVQGYREGAISSEKLHLEKVSRLKNAIDEVYPKLQAQHNKLDAKFFEERAALEAKYHKLYVPFYAKWHNRRSEPWVATLQQTHVVKYCSEYGDDYKNETSRFCSECGIPKVGTGVTDKFYSYCGNKFMKGVFCSECGHERVASQGPKPDETHSPNVMQVTFEYALRA
ncbi:hypothetical protein GIB67_039416 [Kingdonia uniflora]|uniref:FAD-binding PCMH-type domain-containing protein n=1 Tax=Kingdonia uniflora TaxID=39325 RepID=A0A7J7LIS0_9MAGN|nr:hypothetical protein GIB67_039416 [Kingdonia uniflora]